MYTNNIVWDCNKCHTQNTQNKCEKCNNEQGYEDSVGSGWYNMWIAPLPKDFWLDDIGLSSLSATYYNTTKYEVQREYCKFGWMKHQWLNTYMYIQGCNMYKTDPNVVSMLRWRKRN